MPFPSKIEIDLDGDVVVVHDGDGSHKLAMSSAAAFSAISGAWLRCGWDNKYVYGFTWMGRPIIQLPDDMIRIQEVLYRLKPDVLIETGVAHGGSLIFYASLFEAMHHGRVIGVDVDIRPSNRAAIENHELFERITLIEGDSIAPDIVAQVKARVAPGETVIIMLDSNHTKTHVLGELDAYSDLVSPGSYIVAADGIMASLVGAPRSSDDWSWNNPLTAAREFLSRHPEFVMEEPAFPFNEGNVSERVTYWPGGWLRRTS